ncbi:MAG: tyrosine-type recombinase/integrase [Corynebacterium glucuronolyticum]|nr:tyrosine-type recombinase/integrase [Corynebacterium glucuronolyticum]
MLSAGLAPHDFIFRRKSGKLWGHLGRNDFFEQAVGRLVARGVLEQRVTIHGLRHVAAGLLVQSGASVKVVQRQLGHKSAAMTLDTYAELFDGELDQVGVAMGEVFSGVVKLSWSGVPLRCAGG